MFSRLEEATHNPPGIYSYKRNIYQGFKYICKSIKWSHELQVFLHLFLEMKQLYVVYFQAKEKEKENEAIAACPREEIDEIWGLRKCFLENLKHIVASSYVCMT